MRFHSALSLALVPAALVAQAPQTLSQRFNDEAKAVNALLKEFKTADAMAKAEALVPAQRPALTLQNADDAWAYVYALRLWANTCVSAGQWEKAQEVLGKRLEAAKANEADLNQAVGSIEATWTKAVAEGKDFITKNAPRTLQMEKDLEQLAGVKNELQELNSGKKKFKDKKEAEAFQTRLNEYNQKNQELAQLRQDLRVHQENISKAQGVLPKIGEQKADAQKEVKTAEAAVAKVNETLKQQKDEIEKFNAERNEKYKKAKVKKTATGNKEWVNAVMEGKDSITNLATPLDQVNFLNRMLVLDPGNAKVQKAIDNIVAGKGPFEVEKPAKKGGKKAVK